MPRCAAWRRSSVPPSRYTRSNTHAYSPRSSAFTGISLNVSCGSWSPTEVQFTSTAAGRGSATAATPRSAARRWTRSRARFQTKTSDPARRNAYAAGRGLPPAPSTSAVRGAGSPRASRSPGASVLSARIAASGANGSGFAAARPAPSLGRWGGGRARPLFVRDRHVDAGEAIPRQPADSLGEGLRRDRDRLVGVLAVEPERLQRRGLHRGRAAVDGRPAEDGPPLQAHRSTPPSRSGTMCTTTPRGGSSIGGNFTSAPR